MPSAAFSLHGICSHRPCPCASQDFHQKETVGGMSLHKALVTKWVTVPKAPHEKKNKKRKKAVGELTAESKGITTFEKFCRFILTTTHRFNCDVHRENMRAMRSTTAEHPVTLSFLKGLRPRTGNEMQNPLIRFALIGVTSNRERAAFNAAQALEFARFHGRVLVRWKLELRGPEAQNLSSTMLDTLYAEEDSLWGYFVYGVQAPCSPPSPHQHVSS